MSSTASIHSLTSAHIAAVRGIASRPEFTADFGAFLSSEECRKALEQAASVVACDAAGEVIGFLLCSSQPMADGTWQALLRPAVLPEWRRRGIGSAMLEEATTRLRHGSEKTVLHALFGWQPCEALTGFAESQGFTCVRHFHHMERNAADLPELPWPEGITARSFDGSDGMFTAWNAAYNLGFASHFRFCPGTETECREIAAAAGFTAENVILAFHGSEPVGFVRVAAGDQNDDPGSGWVHLLCVAPAHRSRGLGRALLREGMARLQALGCTCLHLTVDAASPTAPQLYAAEGFHSTKVRRIWERVID